MPDLFSNMPCSCGSHLRYADCCGRAQENQQDAYYEKKGAIKGLLEKLVPMAYNSIDTMRAVWCEVAGHRDLPPPEWPDFPFFVHWYVWHLRFGVVDESEARTGTTHASVYLDAHSEEVSPAELEILEASAGATLSIWRVLSIGPRGRMVVYDELGDQEQTILNLTDANAVDPGDVIVGSVIQLEEFGLFLTRAQRLIEPRLQVILHKIKRYLAEQSGSLDPNQISRKIIGVYLRLADWMRDDVAQMSLDVMNRLGLNPDWMN